MNECSNCGFNDEEWGCTCYSGYKWYACPIENKKPENAQAMKEEAEWMEIQRYAFEHALVLVSSDYYEKSMKSMELMGKCKGVLQEIRQKIDGLRYDQLVGNVSNYAVIDVALEIIDACIEKSEEQG